MKEFKQHIKSNAGIIFRGSAVTAILYMFTAII